MNAAGGTGSPLNLTALFYSGFHPAKDRSTTKAAKHTKFLS
jgi:hypothetical protein